MRTQTLGDPKTWRGWDGSGYTIQMLNPYTNPAPERCSPAGVPEVAGMSGSVTRNTYLQSYMLVGTWQGSDGICGWYSSLSDDLIHWSTPQLIHAVKFPMVDCPNGGEIDVYPSIIDHFDPSPNFETPGRTPYIYFTRMHNGTYDLDRDLVRVPVIITRH